MRTSVFHHTGAIKKEMSHPLRKIGKMPLIGDGHQSGFYFFLQKVKQARAPLGNLQLTLGMIKPNCFRKSGHRFPLQFV